MEEALRDAELLSQHHYTPVREGGGGGGGGRTKIAKTPLGRSLINAPFFLPFLPSPPTTKDSCVSVYPCFVSFPVCHKLIWCSFVLIPPPYVTTQYSQLSKLVVKWAAVSRKKNQLHYYIESI